MLHLDGIRRLHEADVARRRVLVRADLNCPSSPDGSVTDATKLLAAAPTLRHLLDAEAQVILVGHRLSAPRKGGDPGLPSLAACGEALAEILGIEVYLPEQASRLLMSRLLNDVGANRLLMLENLSREPGETTTDEAFTRRLAEGVEVFVGDCLDAPAHYASVSRLAKFCPERVIGLRAEQELAEFGAFRGLGNERRGLVLGGSFTESAPLIRRLLGRGLRFCVGGDVGFTLAAAAGADLADTPLEESHLSAARTLLTLARDHGTELIFPCDASVLVAGKGLLDKPLKALAQGDVVVDCGPATVTAFLDALAPVRAVVVAAGIGMRARSHAASTRLLQALTESSVRTIAVASESLPVGQLLPADAQSRLAFVSTAGDSAAALLCGEALPMVECLRLPS